MLKLKFIKTEDRVFTNKPYQRNKGFLLFQVLRRNLFALKVVQNNTGSYPSAECKMFNNFILLYHSDGTFANYVHLKNNGSVVQPGDSVKKGDLIGYGNEPHLHFSCFILANPEKIIKTKFKISDGSKIEYLEEKNITARSIEYLCRWINDDIIIKIIATTYRQTGESLKIWR